MLLPECLDDFIDESNPVRVIDVFVDALDLTEMSFEEDRATCDWTGSSYGAMDQCMPQLCTQSLLHSRQGAAD